MNKIELCGHEECTQCLACKTICPKQCISMIEVEDGFSIPDINREQCIECGACMKACHKISPKLSYNYPQKTLACWTNNISDRENSSSGGAFSVLAKKILSENGIVFGASMDDKLQLKHISIEDTENIIKLQGSKYLQSYMGETYKKVKNQIKTGRKVMFIGTPCQVAGLLTYLKENPDNLLTCDLVCHGVPSQKSFDIYVNKIGIKGKAKNFSFRHTKGWGFQSSYISMDSKKRIHKHILNPSKCYYMRAFNKGLMFDSSCFNCPYARAERVSDITLADFWGLGKEIPFKKPTFRGISCMLINSDKGDLFVKDCEKLIYEERSIDEAIKGNYNLTHKSKKPIGHDSYYDDSAKLSISELSTKYGLTPNIKDYLRLVKQQINTFLK